MEKKEYRISSLSLVVTKKCNLRCEMCTRDAKNFNRIKRSFAENSE